MNVRFVRITVLAAALLAAVAALGLIATYALAGKPGLYGERLFVILKDQADVRPMAAIADRDTRMKAVYDTLTAHADRTQAPPRHEDLDLGGTVATLGGPLRTYLDAALSSPSRRGVVVDQAGALVGTVRVADLVESLDSPRSPAGAADVPGPDGPAADRGEPADASAAHLPRARADGPGR